VRPKTLGEIMKSKKVRRLSKKVSNTLNQRNKRIEKIERRKNEM
tara:strand:- start:386 stop:517 length:132 start_codon:yes stop_codon:yes gene_type:complete